MHARWGVLGTISSAADSAGFPSGSVVEYALPEGKALPVFSLSSLSPHTRDVQRDDRVSLVVPTPGSKVCKGKGIGLSDDPALVH